MNQFYLINQFDLHDNAVRLDSYLLGQDPCQFKLSIKFNLRVQLRWLIQLDLINQLILVVQFDSDKLVQICWLNCNVQACTTFMGCTAFGASATFFLGRALSGAVEGAVLVVPVHFS
jgi:hypothetical protein